MIVLRHKEYSSKALQLVKGVKKMANRVITPVDNAMIKVGNTINQSTNGIRGALGIPKAKVQAPHFKFKPKTDIAIGRETIAARNSVTSIPGKVAEGAKQVVETPIGPVIDKGIQATIKRPDVAIVTATTQVTTPVGLAIGGPVGHAMLLPGYSAAVPVVAKHPLIPKSGRKVLERQADRYSRSRFSRKLKENKTSLRTIGKSVMSTQMPVTGMIPA